MPNKDVRRRVLDEVRRRSAEAGDGVARCGAPEIAEALGVTPRSVRRALVDLEIEGELAVGIVPMEQGLTPAGVRYAEELRQWWASGAPDREARLGRRIAGWALSETDIDCPKRTTIVRNGQPLSETDNPDDPDGGCGQPATLPFPGGNQADDLSLGAEGAEGGEGGGGPALGSGSSPAPDSSGGRRKKEPKRARDEPPIPAALDDSRFRAAWAEWQEYRRGMSRMQKAPWTAAAARRALASLARMGSVEDAVESIHQSIDCGWRGLFPPKREEERRGRETFDDQLDRVLGRE